jgi:endonuclease/exonuclease/phosphatase family metal-dependent hydrolase
MRTMKKTSRFLLLIFCLLSCSGKSKDGPSASTSTGSSGDDSTRQKTITIMTYNIHGGIPQGGTVPDLYALASVIKNAGPDVVLLQEVDSATVTSGKTYQAQTLASLAGFSYYFFANAFSTDGGGFGVAILSKYPIENPSKILLPKIAASGYVEQRVLCKTQVRFSGNMVYTIATSHFDLTDVNRQAGVTTIVNELAQSVYPVVFGGDFNVTPNNSIISRLDSAGFTKTCTSNCYSFQASNPTEEIDYIMYNPATRFSVDSHKVITGITASDHCPVVAILMLK